MLRLKGLHMAEIVGFVSKSERERLRLIREARAIYDSIFPAEDAAGEKPEGLVTAMPVSLHHAAAIALGRKGPVSRKQT